MDQPEIKIKSTPIRKSVGTLDLGAPPDLEVRCVDGVVKCQRKILAAFSPHFNRIEPGVLAIRVPDVPVEIFSTIAKFHQTGECALRRGNLDTILRSAEKLGFKELQTAIKDISKSEVPGILVVEEFVQDASEAQGRKPMLAIQASSKKTTNEASQSLQETERKPAPTSSHSAESFASKAADQTKEEDTTEADLEIVDDDQLCTHNPVVPALVYNSECSKSDPNAQRTPAKTRWSQEEVDTLKEIWPLFWIEESRRLDLRGIAAAMEAHGFIRGTEQVKQRIYRLQREERLIKKKGVSRLRPHFLDWKPPQKSAVGDAGCSFKQEDS